MRLKMRIENSATFLKAHTQISVLAKFGDWCLIFNSKGKWVGSNIGFWQILTILLKMSPFVNFYPNLTIKKLILKTFACSIRNKKNTKKYISLHTGPYYPCGPYRVSEGPKVKLCFLIAWFSWFLTLVVFFAGNKFLFIKED